MKAQGVEVDEVKEARTFERKLAKYNDEQVLIMLHYVSGQLESLILWIRENGFRWESEAAIMLRLKNNLI